MRFFDRSWWSCALLPLALLLVTGLGCSSLPNSAVAVLESADQFRIFRLEPYGESPKADETVFQGHVILAQADVKESNARKKITDIVNRGVRKGGTQAKCFNPRHGIHATRAGSTVDIVICYECSAIEVIENGHSTTLETGDVQSELDDVFFVYRASSIKVMFAAASIGAIRSLPRHRIVIPQQTHHQRLSGHPSIAP